MAKDSGHSMGSVAAVSHLARPRAVSIGGVPDMGIRNEFRTHRATSAISCWR